MKNRIGIICAVVISCLVLASFSPSLDGRAVVADEGTFPQGLFAKTVGYLPGDSITVSNLSTKKTVDILVVGALDPSEGVAILLSSEAAFALGIEKNSNIIVKITKRSGQLDEAVSGTAVIANGTAAAADSTDAAAAPENTAKSEVPADTTASAAETADTSASGTSGDTASAETSAALPEEKNEAQPEPSADESSAETIAATETPAEPETAAPETEDVTAADEKVDEGIPASDKTAAVPAEKAETSADEKVDDTVPASTSTETIPGPKTETVDENAAVETEAVTGEKIDEKTPSAEETAGSERAADTSSPADETAAVPYAEEPEEKVPEAAPAAAADSATDSEKVKEQPVVTDEPPAESEKVNTAAPAENAPSSAENKVTSSDAYASIILVPAAPNPPESSTEPVPETTSSVPVSPAGKPEKETPPATSPSGGEFDRYVVPNLKALKSGTYYIQIGVYADESNIREVVKKYSGTYPVAIVPLVSGKAKQIMIGPLSVDEYAAVMERFKSYGFKDAFLRKIK